MYIETAKRLRTMPEGCQVVVLTDERGRRMGEMQRLPSGRYHARAYTPTGVLTGLDPVSWSRGVSYIAA